ncbi:MAG TPA: hypothetical protein VFN21_07515 [Acidimicrobiales bacterium]|nr:hypothetical protein [Acidimicrobiales bacterium]
MSPITIAEPIADTARGAVRMEGLRGLRYGEVLLVREDQGRFHAEIWNSMGLNDCPQDAWDALNAGEIAAAHGAVMALLNGPRYWLMDVIENVPIADRATERFGDLDMTHVATLDLGTELPDQVPYTKRTVLRDTVWEWSAGRTVHELVDPDGRAFAMQAFCVGIDPTQNEDNLAGLVDRLELPTGWTFRTRKLDEPMRLRAPEGVATIVQDELQNTYHGH